MTIRCASTAFARLLAVVVAAPTVLAACGSNPIDPPTTSAGGAGGSGATTSTGATGGAGGTGGAPPEAKLTVERWGARVWGSILGMSRTDRTLWFGTRGGDDPDGAPGVVHSGLGRLDLDTGEVKIFDAELPQVDYDFGGGPLKGAVSTAGGVQDGTRQLVVAQTGILVIEDGKVTAKAISIPGGANASPTWIAVDRGGGRARIWAATEVGVVRLHADTFAVEKVYGAAELGSIDVGSIAVDPGSGALYAAVYESGGPGSHVARIDGDAVQSLVPGAQGTPAGVVGDIVWSASAKAAVIAVASWDPASGGVATWDGTTGTTLALEGQLGLAARGMEEAFGAVRLAVDEADGLVIVGGNIRAVGPIGILEGGGLAWIDLKTKRVAGLSTTTSFLPGDHIAAIAYDAKTRRTYISAHQPCSETQLGNLGLVAVSFRTDGTPRFERPVLSGVRSMAVVGDDVYLGLRDENPGLSCFGYAVQTGLVRLEANRSGEIIPLVATGSEAITPFAGPTAMATDAKGRFAIGTFRDGTFVGDPAGGQAVNQAGEFGVSLYENDVAWAGADSVWIAGQGVHDPADPVSLADVGPRGAALLLFDPGSKAVTAKHYVRASKDAADVVGLPSDEVAAIALGSDGAAYLACATERVGVHASDRILGDPFVLQGKTRAGGVARIDEDGAITVLAGSDAAPDPRGIAFDSAGKLWVLDAAKGLLRLENGALVSAAAPGGVPAGAYPHGLWRGADQDGAALYDKGASFTLGGVSAFIGDAGHAWRAAPRAKGVLMIGTDEGLVRAHLDSAAAAERPVEAGALPAFLP
jgi:hypothetical protein